MNKEINTIIANLDGCIGMYDYGLTPKASNLLVSYIEELQQENKQLKERYNKLEEKYFANVPCCNENDCDLYRDYMKLKDNWDKLKEIAQSQSDFKLKCKNKKLWFEVDELLDKMHELEKGSDSNE